jgi:type I restriction enzyme M protein
MVTGEIKNKLDRLWDSMWSNQMTNPWMDIQQITYLIFIKMLDDNQIKQERKVNDQIANGLKDVKLKDPIFKEGNYVDKDNGIDVPYRNLRWSVFKEFEAKKAFDNLRDNVFPFIKNLKSDKATSFVTYMKNAQFQIANPYILSKMIDSISDEGLGLSNKDLMGDCYEYLLSKMATSGDNGQFRTPRHIIEMMVELARPTLSDTIIDPAMGTAGFLVGSAKYIQEHYAKELMNRENNDHFHNEMFTGFDTDLDMLRIGCMNMTLHNVDNPRIQYNNSLSEDYTEKDKYSLILANPPFSGSLEPETVSKSLYQISGGTKKSELLFLSLFLRLLKVGGRCVSIVPIGVMNNTNDKAYNGLRKELVENQKLQAIIFMPRGVFQPYANVQTGILVFTKTNSGGTDKVWMYNMEADGYSLDVRRNEIPENDIPDIEERFNHLDAEQHRLKTDKSFLVDKQELVDNNYVFSFNQFQKRIIEKKDYRPTEEIVGSIKDLEKQFDETMSLIEKELEKQ